MTIMRLRYASDGDEMHDPAVFFDGGNTEIILAEEEGEVIGSAIYSENNGLATLEYVNVHES